MDPVVVTEIAPLVVTHADLIPPKPLARQLSARPEIADDVDLVRLAAGECRPNPLHLVDVLGPGHLGRGPLETTHSQRRYGVLVQGDKRSRIDQKEDLSELRDADSLDLKRPGKGLGDRGLVRFTAGTTTACLVEHVPKHVRIISGAVEFDVPRVPVRKDEAVTETVVEVAIDSELLCNTRVDRFPCVRPVRSSCD